MLQLHHIESVTTRRRAESVAIIATGLVIAAVPTLVLVGLLLPDPGVNVPLAASGFVCYALVLALLRRQRVVPAAWVLVSYFAVVPLLGSLVLGSVEASPLFLMVTIVVAACLLPPRQVLVVGLLVYAELGAMAVIDSEGTLTISALLTYVAVATLVLAALGIVLAMAIERALSSADESRRQALAMAADLTSANTELEARVAARTTELEQALHREQRLSATLGELSIRDPLTGLHNRRFLDEELPRIFASAQRRHDPISVAAIDLDNFKTINDRHTHSVGDEVLRVTAQIMARQTRTSDVLVRMGGEEFMLIMPGASDTESVSACERMRAEIEAFDWNSVSPGLLVTASFGVATSGVPATDAIQWTPPTLLKAADELLYRAKREGKNRVTADSPGAA